MTGKRGRPPKPDGEALVRVVLYMPSRVADWLNGMAADRRRYLFTKLHDTITANQVKVGQHSNG